MALSGYLRSVTLMAVFLEGLTLNYNLARQSAMGIVAVWDFALQSHGTIVIDEKARRRSRWNRS